MPSDILCLARLLLLFFTVGSDFTAFEPFQISFSTSSSNFMLLEVTTTDDSIIDPNEYFEIVILRYSVMDSDNNTQNLTDQERRRILIENSRARVSIVDSDGMMNSSIPQEYCVFC